MSLTIDDQKIYADWMAQQKAREATPEVQYYKKTTSLVDENGRPMPKTDPRYFEEMSKYVEENPSAKEFFEKDKARTFALFRNDLQWNKGIKENTPEYEQSLLQFAQDNPYLSPLVEQESKYVRDSQELARTLPILEEQFYKEYQDIDKGTKEYIDRKPYLEALESKYKDTPIGGEHGRLSLVRNELKNWDKSVEEVKARQKAQAEELERERQAALERERQRQLEYAEFMSSIGKKRGFGFTQLVSLGLSIFAPGIGTAIGTALGASGVAASVIGSSIVQGVLSEASGGDFIDGAVTGAVMAGVAPAVASSVGNSVAQSMADSVFREVVVNATASASASAVAAAVTGKDIGESALIGAVTGAAAPIGRLTGGTIAEAMGSSALKETVANAIAGATSSSIAAGILNKDVGDAALTGFVGGAASSIGRELGTAAEYGTTPYSEQNQMLLAQERGMGTSGSTGANLGAAAGAISLGADPMFSLINAAAKTSAESALSQTRPGTPPIQNAQAEKTDDTSIAQDAGQAETQSVAEVNPLDAINPAIKNIEQMISGPSAQVVQSGDQNADLAVIDSLLPEEQKSGSSTTTVTAPDGSQLVYDQDNNLIDIIEAPDTSVVAPEPLVPDALNPNLEPGKTPQERAAEEWQRYLDSLTNKPEDLDLPGSTIDTGEYWDEYNQNLQRIMDEGGYTSQWQRVNGDRVFISDDGTAIGINENGGTYALSESEVENMVENGLLNTAESGYVEATGGTGTTPGGTSSDSSEGCGEGFHWDESRQMCIPDEDEAPQTQDCPEGYVFDLNTQTCVPVSVDPTSVSLNPSVKTVSTPTNISQTNVASPSSRNLLGGILGADVISRAIPDEPSRKLGFPIYEKMDKFEGPLDDFLRMVSGGSYVNKPDQQPQQPQQVSNMNMPIQPDLLDRQPNYFNYGRETNIDQNLFGGQNSLNYDRQLFGGQNSLNYDQQLFSNPMPFKAGGMVTPLMAAGGTTRYGQYAGGGLSVVEHSGKQRLDFREGAAVTGEGDGQSDDIPAMLADGEFVFPADVVAALGNGSTKAGSDKLYDMMHAIRAHHRSAKPEDLPPPAKKSPLDYLKTRKARG